jgi:transposase
MAGLPLVRSGPGLMLHRSRRLLVRQRTMLSNAIRGHMAELGIISAKGRKGTAELLEIIANADDHRIPAVARLSLDALVRQYTNTTAEIRNISMPGTDRVRKVGGSRKSPHILITLIGQRRFRRGPGLGGGH